MLIVQYSLSARSKSYSKSRVMILPPWENFTEVHAVRTVAYGCPIAVIKESKILKVQKCKKSKDQLLFHKIVANLAPAQKLQRNRRSRKVAPQKEAPIASQSHGNQSMTIFAPESTFALKRAFFILYISTWPYQHHLYITLFPLVRLNYKKIHDYSLKAIIADTHIYLVTYWRFTIIRRTHSCEAAHIR